MDKDEGFHLTSNWSFVLTGSFFCVNVYVLCKMYVKHRYSLEPTHVFEMSTVFDIVVWSATFILTNFEKYFENLAPFCIILNFVDSNTRKVLKWQTKFKQIKYLIICLIKFINIESERLAQIANVILIFFVIQQFYLGGQFMQAFVLDRSTRDQAKPQIMLSKDCKYLISRPPFPFVLL